jgi:hypothetical protein
MATNVLLHVNAMQTNEDSRAVFYQLLKENLWIRMHSVYTTWCCRYSDDVYDVPEEVIGEIRRLAALAGVTSFNAVAQCGNTQAFWFEYSLAKRADLLHPWPPIGS